MNRGNGRLAFYACLTFLIGCGARTSTLEEELGGQDAGGSSGTAGSSAGFGGVHPTPHGGASSGAPPFAGAPPSAGFGSGGSPPIPAGGAASAGSPAGGFGTGGVAGSFGGFAGFGAIGGDAGTGGIGEVCSVLGGTCAECQCKTCAPAIEACFSELGCTFILACAQQTGCTGFSCYSPTTCKPVIDQFGGLGGVSIKKVFSLLSCAASSQASCGCN
jgi:hypothetical protein